MIHKPEWLNSEPKKKPSAASVPRTPSVNHAG